MSQSNLSIFPLTLQVNLTFILIADMSIQDRKKEHVELTVYKDVLYQKSNGFEKYRFNHSALPEVNYDEVSLSGEFLGRTFSFPLFIASMRGGYAKGGAVNAQIAKFCEAQNLPFGVGSQRIMVEKPAEMESFSIVREFAPTAFIASNIGGAQLIRSEEHTSELQSRGQLVC